MLTHVLCSVKCASGFIHDYNSDDYNSDYKTLSRGSFGFFVQLKNCIFPIERGWNFSRVSGRRNNFVGEPLSGVPAPLLAAG